MNTDNNAQAIQLFYSESDAVDRIAERNKTRTALVTMSKNIAALEALPKNDFFDAHGAGVIKLLRTIALDEDPINGTFRLTWDAHTIEVIASADGHISATVDGQEVLSDRVPDNEFLYIGDGQWLHAVIKFYRDKLARLESEARRAQLLREEQAAARLRKPF